jgi:hypothetical protein
VRAAAPGSKVFSFSLFIYIFFSACSSQGVFAHSFSSLCWGPRCFLTLLFFSRSASLLEDLEYRVFVYERNLARMHLLCTAFVTFDNNNNNNKSTGCLCTNGTWQECTFFVTINDDDDDDDNNSPSIIMRLLYHFLKPPCVTHSIQTVQSEYLPAVYKELYGVGKS